MRRDPPLPKRIAALVGQIRVAGMTPAAIARESGISRQTIWRIEAGEISRPSYDTIERLERLWARISIIRE
ncbi:helix-turn-helix domain-containing protein [Sinorhizobium meliloti]|uniref:helix-turn-helix domain-containing protein n=1 Tax=Rhizobium meliloti TaxID=382 RepID=UPI000FE00D34|nr:helix-turn-helix transcriptional regulator [Sinorhizobium meliloti]MDX0530311.1 helix-turn-helix domain-containing protein [Sinorhizobium medicae]MDW9898505.1 helix-turn-helix domain-containing protein [Sinorhizobium meliloti]MDX0183247.1 helix-turn-helix domain-containing protein [Sinorhizobium meliloti]MDX1083219.1 helix-turn-helix domain-containing protein [Sinorhizobium medicae]MDX1186329.1 helix-turn-helix domain-containing protein [Sinorhizobium medicae]